MRPSLVGRIKHPVAPGPSVRPLRPSLRLSRATNLYWKSKSDRNFKFSVDKQAGRANFRSKDQRSMSVGTTM